MRMPRVRFTVRRLMVAVAVLALVAAIGEMTRRSASYDRLARYYAERETLSLDLMAAFARPDRPELSEVCSVEYARNRAFAEHEERLKRKYRRAARYPWLPVAPDPPEPE
jgi:hypothetical protein